MLDPEARNLQKLGRGMDFNENEKRRKKITNVLFAKLNNQFIQNWKLVIVLSSLIYAN